MTRSASTATRVVAWLVWLSCMLALWSPGVALARDIPPLRGHVNDTADMLSDTAEQALERKLIGYEEKTGHQFALLTIDSLDGDSLEDFSIRVVEAWKLGRKGKDDGLLLLVAKRERKLRIEVGYGLEGDVTDAFTAQVRRNVLTPALRAGNAEQGIQSAFDALMHKAAGEAVPEDVVASPKQDAPGPSWLGLLGLLFIAAPFVLPLLFLRGRSRRTGILLGGLGGWGGGWSSGGGGWGGRGGGGWGGGGWGGGGGGGGWSGGGGGFGGGGSSGSW